MTGIKSKEFEQKFQEAKKILSDHPGTTFKELARQLNVKSGDTVRQWFYREKHRAAPHTDNFTTAEDMIMALVAKINKQASTIEKLEAENLSLKKSINDLTIGKQSLLIQVRDALGRRD